MQLDKDPVAAAKVLFQVISAKENDIIFVLNVIVCFYVRDVVHKFLDSLIVIKSVTVHMHLVKNCYHQGCMMEIYASFLSREIFCPVTLN